MLGLSFLLSAPFPYSKKSRAWNKRLKIILTFLGLEKYPRNKPTPQLFITEPLFFIVTKPIYYNNIANSHILSFLEQINIFIKICYLLNLILPGCVCWIIHTAVVVAAFHSDLCGVNWL